MNQIWSDKKIFTVSVAAATVTIIAGILHLLMVQRSLSHNPLEGILFLVGGTAQVFWALPVMKRWGRVWWIIGIVGTGIFVLLYFLDRLHLLHTQEMQSNGGNIHQGGNLPDGGPAGQFGRGDNMPGRGGRPEGGGSRPFIGGTALPIEITQILFIGLYLTMAKMISNRKSTST